MTTASVEHRVVNKSQATTHTPSLLRRARRVATTRATERRIGAERSSKLGGARARASVLGASANKDARTSSPSVAEIASSRDEGGATKQLAKAGQSALAALAVMSVAPDAFAKGGELGILEGRTIALIHPATMFSLLAATGYIGYLGWQWRRVRTIGEEITELKKQVKKQVKKPELVAATGEAAADQAPAAPSPLETQISDLQDTRKKLVEGKYKDKHFVWASALLAMGVTFSIEGGLNTYTRVGKLFPGPHLFAGASMTALWAIGAALVPAMQKGSKLARDAHITVNGITFLLFLWQVPTGLEIVGKVFQFTKWP